MPELTAQPGFPTQAWKDYTTKQKQVEEIKVLRLQSSKLRIRLYVAAQSDNKQQFNTLEAQRKELMLKIKTLLKAVKIYHNTYEVIKTKYYYIHPTTRLSIGPFKTVEACENQRLKCLEQL